MISTVSPVAVVSSPIENSGFDGTCGLEGITIRRGNVISHGGAVLVLNTSPVSQPFIARCTIAGCQATGHGGAIHVSGGSLFLYESELFANEANYGGALSVASLSSSHAVYGLRCTVAYNYARISEGGGGGLFRSGNGVRGNGNGVSVHKTTLTTRILPVTGRAWPAASALNIPARITT